MQLQKSKGCRCEKTGEEGSQENPDQELGKLPNPIQEPVETKSIAMLKHVQQ